MWHGRLAHRPWDASLFLARHIGHAADAPGGIAAPRPTGRPQAFFTKQAFSM